MPDGRRAFMWLLAAVAFLACHRPAQPTEAQLVAEATAAIDACYHWSGEVGDQGAERNKEIAQGVERDCPVARDKGTSAWKQFPGNAVLAAHLLQLIDAGHFTPGPGEKNGICETSVAELTKGFLGSKQADPLFSAECPAQATRLYGK